MEENARRLQGKLAGLKKQLDSFSDVFDRLGTHLRHAQQSYEDAESKLTRAQNSLEQMSQGVFPDAAQQALEPAPDE